MANTSNTFWDIITQYKIEIPQLQRDYAQGRNTAAIKQIRKSLISEIYDSLTSGKKLVLNFIYGEREQELFVPIDGQQRLTTLFLVHWYIFKRAHNSQGLDTLVKFSYKTRNSSQRFCKRLLEVNIDFSLDIISNQIKDSFWYSGHFTNDPTIQSMIVVIDEIHNQFKEIQDFDAINLTLINVGCPITFLWLPMDNFQKRDDLYIKMNARGKLLTDFEIFKAKLQNSNMLSMVLGGTATNEQRLKFISKFNNEYSELFYKYYRTKFDEAMMSFIQAVVRDEYFSYICEAGVTQKEYRHHYKEPLNMNGNVFFNFMEIGGFNFNKCNFEEGKIVFLRAIKKIDRLLLIFSENITRLDTIPKITDNHYDDLELFKKSFSQGTDAENFAKFSLYEYLYKFGFPDSKEKQDAYSMWKRFIYNLICNTDVAGHIEYICDAMAAIKQIIYIISQATETDVLTGISSFNKPEHISGIKHQLAEEKIKATLMLSNQEWKQCILDAEKYYFDGQIGFLLDYSKRKNGKPDITEFLRGFSISKMLFNEHKQVKDLCNSVMLEQSLLTMQDNTLNHTAHLIKQPNSTTSWGFCRKDYNKLLANITEQNKKNILFELFDKLNETQNINDQLKVIIDSIPQDRFYDNSMWKRYFVNNNLFDEDMNGWQFDNCINLGNNNHEVLMLIGTTVRSYSMELKTYLLYRELLSKKNSQNRLSLHLEPTGDMVENGYPKRYIEWNHKKIAFMGNSLDSNDYSVMNDDGSIKVLDYATILKMIEE